MLQALPLIGIKRSYGGTRHNVKILCSQNARNVLVATLYFHKETVLSCVNKYIYRKHKCMKYVKQICLDMS